MSEIKRKPAGRTPVHEPVHTPEREIVYGRDGEELKRSNTTGIDKFHIDPSIIPQGWDWQWNVVSVTGNTDIGDRYNVEMHRQGWRPVLAESYPGLYFPAGKTGAIVVEGMRLDERPLKLTEEARAEDIGAANRQLRDRNEALMGGKAALRSAMGQASGFEMSGARGTGGDIRMNIDASLDGQVPRQSYQTPED